MGVVRLTPDRQTAVVAMIRAGGSVETAAAGAQIGRRTVYDLMARDSAFRDAVEAARAQAEQDLVATIVKASAKSWRAAAWLLERRYPERWARRSAVPTPTRPPSAAAKIRDELAARREAAGDD